MRLIINGLNGNYLRDIMESNISATEEVLAAVAYASQGAILFDWCFNNNIPLKYIGRLDEGVAVSTPILKKFLNRKSPEFACYLVEHHHAKVIWWRGAGMYIGSANLTDSAWTKNVEVGCYFAEDEISDEMSGDILGMFNALELHSTVLSEELFEHMKKREKDINSSTPKSDQFWSNSSISRWDGLVTTGKKQASSRQREAFLKEWYATLQILRDIAARVSRPENRPAWINKTVPAGALADQFLHAHYYQQTFVNKKSNYVAFYELNKIRKEKALLETIDWWKALDRAPSGEDIMLNTVAPELKSLLSEERLKRLTLDDLNKIFLEVHAIKDYARRVQNKSVGLLDGWGQYSIKDKVEAFSKRIWNDRSSGGHTVSSTFHHVLYGGPSDQLPERLWQAVTDPEWKIDGLGISAFGELVGWALPDKFPPRNGRTSKALKSLGYDVVIHVA